MIVFGSVQKSSVSLAVDRGLPPDMTSKLEAVADLEYTDGLEDLENRVSAADGIAGVYLRDGKVIVLCEGNEGQGFAASRRSLVSAALRAEDLAYTSEAIEGHSSLAYVISMACIFLLALFIGGAALGLGGVSERESGILRAVSVSPMTLWAYMIEKIIPALLLGLVGVCAGALLMGRAASLPQFVLLALSSVFVSGLIIFLIIAFAGNQIAAVGVLKIIMPLFLVVGAAAAFIPEKWHALFYALPMYWQYAAIEAILSGREPAFQLLMVSAVGLPWFIAVILVFTKKVKMKAGR
jgi:ABC-type multidrug transport system permease subunit